MFRNLLAVIAASRIVRMNLPIKGDIPVLGVLGQEKQVIRLPLNADTAMDGLQSLFFDDRKGHLIVQPLARTEVSYRDFEVLKSYSGTPKIGTKVWLSGWLGEHPADFGIDEYTDVTLQNGTQAWMIPGGDDWIISVHGRKATRAETLRIAPALRELGYTNLVISHETDDWPAGLGKPTSNLGVTEWTQIEMAVKFAIQSGSKSISLYGWSLGCMFIGQYLRKRNSHDEISKIIFDSPLLDFQSTIRLQASNAGLNSSFGELVISKLRESSVLKLLGLARQEIPDIFFDLKCPTLVLYSQLDGYVSMNRLDEFLSHNPAARLLHFIGARHCRLFNQNPARYENALREFLGK